VVVPHELNLQLTGRIVGSPQRGHVISPTSPEGQATLARRPGPIP
jgi:hypothetical protein